VHKALLYIGLNYFNEGLTYEDILLILNKFLIIE